MGGESGRPREAKRLRTVRRDAREMKRRRLARLTRFGGETASFGAREMDRARTAGAYGDTRPPGGE